MSDPLPLARGLTPAETARLLRISPDKVRALIQSGALGALNIGSTRRDGKARYVILPIHLEQFARQHAAATIAKPPPRRRRQPSGAVDFYPGD